MRIGEVLGLTWDKFNIFNKQIEINEAFDEDTKELTHLKDHTDPRTIQVQQLLFDYMAEYKKWRVLAQKQGIVISINNYVFAGEQGTPITISAVNRYLARLCERTKILRITTHGWRRTQATLMTLATVDNKFIASFLGHSVATLEKYYIRETEDLKKQNRDLRESFFKDQGLA